MSSRNLGTTSCYFCGGAISLDEAPRPITKKEAGGFFLRYVDMIVAKCHCFDCEAQYLAWMDNIPYGGMGLKPPLSGIKDLSFQRTFGPEPAIEDLPRYHIVQHIELERIPYAEPPPPDRIKRRWK